MEDSLSSVDYGGERKRFRTHSDDANLHKKLLEALERVAAAEVSAADARYRAIVAESARLLAEATAAEQAAEAVDARFRASAAEARAAWAEAAAAEEAQAAADARADAAAARADAAAARADAAAARAHAEDFVAMPF